MNAVAITTLGFTIFGLLGCITFVVSYHVLTRGAWWHTEYGRFLMLFQGNLGTLLALVFVNRVFGDWTGRTWVTMLLFAAYAVQCWWPIRLLWRAQRGHLRREKKDDSRS